MALVIEAKQAIDNTMIRLGKNGKLESVEVDRAAYVEPMDREHLLMITGRSEPFELEGQFGTQTKVRIEFEVLRGKQAGGRFTSMFTLTVGRKSNLGELIAAARNKDIAEGEGVDIDEYIGHKLYANTRIATSAKTGNSYVTIVAPRPMDDEEEAQATPKSAKQVTASWDDEE